MSVATLVNVLLDMEEYCVKSQVFQQRFKPLYLCCDAESGVNFKLFI